MQRIKSLSSCIKNRRQCKEYKIKIGIIKNEEKLKYSKSVLSLGEENILGARLLDKILCLFGERAESRARTHARMCIVKMQLTHDSTFCRGRGYETKSPHLQGTLK